MTNVKCGIIRVTRLIFSDWAVYAIVSATIVGILLETSIIRVSGFENTGVSTYALFFVGLSVFCIISQLIILKFVINKIEKSFGSRRFLHMSKIKKALVAVQLGIIVLIIIVLLEIGLTYSYQTVFIIAILMTSFLTAGVNMALLSWRFIIWLKSHKNRVTVTYLAASLFISTSAISGVVYFLNQLLDQPPVVHAKLYSDFITHVETGNPSLVYFYMIFSAVAFVSLWLGTVFLLQSYGKRIGSRKYWIVMSIPLLYFLSQFQPAIVNFLLSYASTDPTLFNLVYILMVDASRPIGGVLFGFAFIYVARRLQNRQVSGYLVMSGIGLFLLLVSYHSQDLIETPFPPLGLLSASYFGLSSFLIFVGIYSSALSISQDSILRASIRKSVETEVGFLKEIGDAEMSRRILERVSRTSKDISEIMPEETGIASSLTDKEIKEYVKVALALALKRRAEP
jgi:hypothetical protein